MTTRPITVIDEGVVDAAVAQACEFISKADPSIKRDRYGITNRIDDIHRALAGSVLGGLTRFVHAARDDLIAREGPGAWGAFRAVECRVAPTEANGDILYVRTPDDRTYRLVCSGSAGGPDLPYDQVMLYGSEDDGRQVLLATASLRDMPSLRAAGLASLVVSDSSLVAEDPTVVLDLTDALRPAFGDDMRIEFGPMPRSPGIEELTAADGGLPGAHWRAALSRLDDTLASSTLRWAASRIGGLVEIANENGLVHGGDYLAFDDTDKRIFAIPGRQAIFLEDIDLTTDRCAFVLDVDGDTVALNVLDIEECDIPSFLSDYPAGSTQVGVTRIVLDLATGVVACDDVRGMADVMANVRYGIGDATRALGMLSEGRLELGMLNVIKRASPRYCREPVEVVGPTP